MFGVKLEFPLWTPVLELEQVLRDGHMLFIYCHYSMSENHVMCCCSAPPPNPPSLPLPFHLGLASPADTESLLCKHRVSDVLMVLRSWWDFSTSTLSSSLKNSAAVQQCNLRESLRCCLRRGPYFPINKQCYPINKLLLTNKSKLWDIGNIGVKTSLM